MIKEIDYSKYCVIIPAYNAENHIGNLIVGIQQINPNLNIIVVNDGSSDHTASIVAENNDITLIQHQKNMGKGAAIKTGIRTALNLNFRYAIFIDADMQHDPRKINKFIQTREKNDIEMVLGIRTFRSSGMPSHRILSNSITSFMISIRTGKRIHDSQCGYRLIDILRINPDQFSHNGFQFESEFLIKMVATGMHFSEISIPTTYNQSGSSINNIMDTMRFISLYLASFFWF